MADADAIVIGAGLNGLAAAVHLAQRNWQVLVLDQNAEPGGAVRTAEVTLPGFRHDLYAMNLNLFAGSPFFAEHGAVLTANGLEFVNSRHPFASAFAAGGVRYVAVEAGLEATLAHIRRVSPADEAAWQRMNDLFDELAGHLFALLGTPQPSAAFARAMWAMYRKLGPAKIAELAKLITGSARSWVSARFEHADVRALLATWGMHLDFAPDIAGGALFPFLEAMVSQRFGMTLGAGGADTVVRAMVAAIGQSGGEVRTSCRVTRIRVSNRCAVAVETADGQTLSARRAIIANVHPRALYGPLLGDAAPAGCEPARSLRPGPGTMMIHLALDAPMRWAASDELARFAYVHLAESLDQMARTYAEVMAGKLPIEPVLVVGQPTAVDPSRAPVGKHIAWIQVRMLPAQIVGDAAGTIAATDWAAAAEPYADRVLTLLERHAPGTRDHIVARHVLSPTDLERENPNLVGGDSLSGSHHFDQFYFLRPAWGRTTWSTGVKLLYHVGASTWPGAGTGCGSGYMLARKLAR